MFSVFSVSCMYVFKADHLALDNQLMCPSLVKAISPASSVACSSLCMAEATWTFLHQLKHIYCSSCSGQVYIVKTR